jgi:beta-1,4-mannosyltransferase
MRVAFVPVWPTNPYHAELEKALSLLGVEVLSPISLKSFWHDFKTGAAKVDVMHLHALPRLDWSPTNLGRYALFFFRLRQLQKRGVRLVWTVHDLQNHESEHRWMEDLLSRAFARRFDAIIVHGETAKQIIQSRWGGQTCERLYVIPHGHYIDSYRNEIDAQTARAHLGFDSANLVFLFFGLIRPYKGVEQLVEAFRALAETNLRLIIAGKPIDEAIQDKIALSSQGDSRIKFLPGHIAADEVQIYMRACDVVVLPYKRILTSGAAVLAMSFGKPCVAPLAGCVVDMLDEEGAVYFDPLIAGDLERALRQTVACRQRLPEMGLHNLHRAAEWDWDKIGRATAAVYEECLAA